VGAGLGFLGAGAAILVAASLALQTRHDDGASGVGQQWESLQVYDIAGAVAREPGLALPVFQARAPWIATVLRAEGARLYAPSRIDSLQPVLDRIEADDASAPIIADQWRNLVLRHPLTYLRVRAAAFGWVLLTPQPARCVMVYTGVDGAADDMAAAGLVFRRTGLDKALARYALPLERTPVSSHAAYALAGLALLVVLLRRRRPADVAVAAMLAAALTFAASFAVISIACDYRYLYDLDLAVLAAGLYAAASLPNSPGGRGGRTRRDAGFASDATRQIVK
jgi:hypothetical protein